MNSKVIRLAGAGMLILGAAVAQTSVALRVDVPFEFTVGQTMMPAGEYTVHSLAQPYVVHISAADRSGSIISLTQAAEAATASDRGRLVFRKYGDRYFLAQIWPAGLRAGHALPMSKTERELTRRAARAEAVSVLARR